MRSTFVRRLRGSELGGLAGDSVYVALWQGAVSAADLVQIAVITRALGIAEYGKLVLVVAFVALVGQLFDVRIGAAATTFGARRLAHSVRAAAGVFQLTYVVDLVTGVVGFTVVALLAPLVGPRLIGDGGTALILLYALTILASTVDESSLTVLRLLDRFRLLAGVTIALETVRIALLVGAVTQFGTLTAAIVALLLYDCLAAVVTGVLAAVVFRRASGGTPLTRPALATVREDRRAMLSMMVHTNVLSYARLAQTQVPTIFLGAVVGVAQVGVYKIGMAASAIIAGVAHPPYAALLPRLARLWGMGRTKQVRRLIRHSTMISVPVFTLLLIAVVVLRDPILGLLAGPEVVVGAAAVLVIASLGQAVNGALFWNMGVLFMAARSRAVSQIALMGLVVQVALLFPLVLYLDAIGAAIAFTVSMLATNLVAGWLAVRALRGSSATLINRPPVPQG